MHEWHLDRSQLPSLILAADARFTNPNYCDDQIWDLHLSSGEPAALTLRTTYGLRVRTMRLFPRLIEGDHAAGDPAQFYEPPTFRKIFSNYALVACAPFSGLDAVFEYWVVASNQVGGRIRLINSGVTRRSLRLEWIASLVSGGEAFEPLSPQKMDGVNVLVGKSANLNPVIFLSGGAEAESSPSTSLSVNTELLPGVAKTFTWGHGAAEEPEISFELARSFAARKWDEEIARIEMTNAAMLRVETGEPSWDLAFSLGQTAAYRLLHGPTEHLPHRSFVHTRLPDQGYSLRGDGSDYDHLWTGQKVLETWHLCTQLLPAYPDIATGLLENFLLTQDPDGCIDWRPSLNGKRTSVTATPMICSLALRLFQLTGDRVWLVKFFPRLQKFLQHWFSAEHDRDLDGIPEWTHTNQTGYEDNPAFAHWQSWAQGAEISEFESPSLSALLYRECESLIAIAREINYVASIPALEEKRLRLRRSLEAAWDLESAAYRYRDRETHESPSGFVLTRQKGPGTIIMTERAYNPPARLSVRVRRAGETSREPAFTIEGSGPDGAPQDEEIPPERVRWALDWGTVVSAQVYQKIDRIKIEGIGPEDEVVVLTLDYRHLDQTLLAPLWAAIPDESQARLLIEKTILNPGRFLREYGLAACSTVPAPEAEVDCESVWVAWNCLIGEGLLNYGEQAAAADLVTRMMAAITGNLAASGAFRKQFHGRTGAGIGERNAVLGLPPLDLFLSTLGVRIESIWRVHLEGANPYPWPVALHFRGLSILRGLDATEITFPNGETVRVTSEEPCIVEGR